MANVRAFGAKGDGVTDDSTAFALAASYVYTAGGGGVVVVPPGQYKLYSLATTNLSLPVNVSLKGTYESALSHNGYRDGAPYPTGGGSVLLMPTGGGVAGYIVANTNCTIEGFVMYEPAQTQTTSPPTSGPAWISMRGKNPTVRYVEMLNPYWGIEANSTATIATERPVVEHVTGQPLYVGISVGDAGYGGIADCARLSDIHWNPWFSYPQPGTSIPATLYNWTQANGTAFLIGDNDEIICSRLFCYGYRYGLRCVQGTNAPVLVGYPGQRGPYGSFVGCGFDTCYVCVQVDKCQPQSGIRFTACGFVSALGGSPYGIKMDGPGAVKVDGSDFWGLSTIAHCQNNGGSTLIVSGCGFQSSCTTFLGCTAGRIWATGCDFNTSGTTASTTSTGKINVIGGGASGGFTSSGSGVTSASVVSY